MRLVRVDDRAVAAVAVASGIAAAWSDVAPTGTSVVDALLVFLAVGAVAWGSASAPWWASTVAAGVVAIVAVDPVVALLGVAGWLAGMWVGTQRRSLSVIRATLGGLVGNLLCWLEFGLFLGASALIGVGLGIALIVLGLQRRHSVVRRRAAWVAACLGVLVVLAVVGLGAAGLGARDDVSAGRRLVSEGIDLMREGEYADAADRFDLAADAFADADTAIGRPWTQPARLVPIAAQNRRAVAVIADRAATAAADLAAASRVIDPDDLRVTDGRFDLERIAEIEPRVAAAYGSMVVLREDIERVESAWLVSGVESRLDAAAAEFDDNIDRVDTAVQALRVLPDLLGSGGERRYFVAFTTPAEARGTGGFMGNYAVLTAVDGQLAVSEFGRTADLNTGGTGERRLDPPTDWEALWGTFGFTSGPDGTTGDVPWSNITISPHFPSTAEVITQLFPQSGGSDVDGVFALDPYVLQAMIEFTGPITVDAGEADPRRLTRGNTADFLLFDQYTIDDSETRIDLLETVAEMVIDDLLGGALPGPTVLADRLGPLAREGRLVGWMRDDAEQALFERIGASGALPDPEGGDGFQVVINNAGANKLDAFLDRSVRYRAQFDERTGVVVGTIDVTLTNNGPSEGLPDGVIGNYLDDPIGTNRSMVSVYTALPVTNVSDADGVVRFVPGVEAGWNVSQVYLAVPSGETRTVSFTVAGQVTADGGGAYRLVVGTQPLVAPVVYDISVTDPVGEVVVDVAGRSPGVRRWSSASSVPSGESAN